MKIVHMLLLAGPAAGLAAKAQAPASNSQPSLTFLLSPKGGYANVGYEYHGYREDSISGQNYLAHTVYTSGLWSF